MACVLIAGIMTQETYSMNFPGHIERPFSYSYGQPRGTVGVEHYVQVAMTAVATPHHTALNLQQFLEMEAEIAEAMAEDADEEEEEPEEETVPEGTIAPAIPVKKEAADTKPPMINIKMEPVVTIKKETMDFPTATVGVKKEPLDAPVVAVKKENVDLPEPMLPLEPMDVVDSMNTEPTADTEEWMEVDPTEVLDFTVSPPSRKP